MTILSLIRDCGRLWSWSDVDPSPYLPLLRLRVDAFRMARRALDDRICRMDYQLVDVVDMMLDNLCF